MWCIEEGEREIAAFAPTEEEVRAQEKTRRHAENYAGGVKVVVDPEAMKNKLYYVNGTGSTWYYTFINS